MINLKSVSHHHPSRRRTKNIKLKKSCTSLARSSSCCKAPGNTVRFSLSNLKCSRTKRRPFFFLVAIGFLVLSVLKLFILWLTRPVNLFLNDCVRSLSSIIGGLEEFLSDDANSFSLFKFSCDML